MKLWQKYAMLWITLHLKAPKQNVNILSRDGLPPFWITQNSSIEKQTLSQDFDNTPSMRMFYILDPKRVGKP